jgi:hypothetical protein
VGKDNFHFWLLKTVGFCLHDKALKRWSVQKKVNVKLCFEERKGMLKIWKEFGRN